MKRTVVILTFLLAVPILFAGEGLSKKYKNWDRTPEAYFLTKAEKAQWKKIQTDADAQNFILDYKTKRGPDFERVLNERVAAADKYFSAGETKGSETLRGKVIIMFGPPSTLDRANGNGKADANEGTSPALQSQGGGGRAGAGDESLAMSSGGASPMGAAPHHAEAPTMTFVYDAASAPKAIGKPFKVEVKMISSSYQEAANPDELNPKFEAVAEASIVTAEGPKPPEPKQ